MRRGEPDHLPPPPHATVAPPYRPLLAACPPGESAPGMLLERPARPTVQSLLACHAASGDGPAIVASESHLPIPARTPISAGHLVHPPAGRRSPRWTASSADPAAKPQLAPWLEEVPNASGQRKIRQRKRESAMAHPPPKSMFLGPCSRWGPIQAYSLNLYVGNRVASPPPPRNPPSPRPPHLIIGLESGPRNRWRECTKYPLTERVTDLGAVQSHDRRVLPPALAAPGLGVQF